MLVLGLDTGGTFTDAVLYDAAAGGVLRSAKTPTIHADYAACVEQALDALALSAAERARLARLHLSTTLATNAVAEGQLSPTALLLEPGDVRPPAALHPRLVLLESMMGFDGRAVRPVSPQEVLEKTAAHAAQVSAFAVSCYAATRNAAHEERIGQLLWEAYGKPVVLGSSLSARLNFALRARAAALNAGLLPVILAWLQAVRTILERKSIRAPLYVVKGDGSLMTEAQAASQPVQTLLSGPAASLKGGAWLCGEERVVVVDVGGTTTDLGRASGGQGRLRSGGLEINGSQIAIDGLDLHTWALGGDSGLRLGAGAQLRFGPLRCLPLCRLFEWAAPGWLERLEEEARELWHFGDLQLLTLVALPPQARAPLLAETAHHPSWLQERLQGPLQAPQRLASLAQGLEKPQRTALSQALEGLLARRLLVRCALTPTDLACARGNAPQFDRNAACRGLALYAKVLDLPAAGALEALLHVLRLQALQVLGAFLLKDPPALEGRRSAAAAPLQSAQPQAQALFQNLVQRMENTLSPTETALRMLPDCPIALVGAGAQAVFQDPLPGLQPCFRWPEHRQVANAAGAAVSRFLLRAEATIEPLAHSTRYLLFAAQAPQEFLSLAQALESARQGLRNRLLAQAKALGLGQPALQLQEDILEEDAPFSRKTRKAFLMAKLQATLSASPP